MTVYLVGAGPGDPTLLTIRAAELLARADVVVYDRLVDERILELVAPSAKLIDVGKQPGEDPSVQDSINEVLISQAGLGSIVVRLKGGDPFVFGRGGEEASALEDAGVSYEIVPGVSSVTAAPAAAGVPLTMRGIASQVTIVTGHDPEDVSGVIDWAALAKSTASLVIVMGVAKRAEIARALIEGGRRADTPVLVVEAASTPRQRSSRTTLDELGALVVHNPATIVVGEVASMRLASFEDRALFSWRVVVTRARHQRNELSSLLAGHGADVIHMPAIEIAPPRDRGAALERALGHLGDFEWIVFSSENAVESFFGALHDARSLGDTKLAAVGSQTAAALANRGVIADLVATSFGADALADEFPVGDGRVLLPRSSLADDTLPSALAEKGWQVQSVEAYETRPASIDERARQALAGAQAIVFTSPSTARHFVESLGRDAVPPVVCSIGPSTSKAVHQLGLEVSIEAPVHTVAGVVDALVAYALASKGGL
jgi:uroporphyrinogen III methyltransferase/synthase